MLLTRTLRASAFAGLSLVVMSASVRAAALSLEPTVTTVGVGGTFSIDLLISDLGGGLAPSVSGFDVAVDYDPALLLATGVLFGDPVLGDQLDLFGFGFPLTGFDLSLAGRVSLAETSFNFPDELDDFQTPEFILASIAFSALAPTSGTPLFVDPTTALIIDSLGESLDVQFRGSRVNIEPRAVPEPATFVLLGLGGAGFSLRRRGRATRPLD